MRTMSCPVVLARAGQSKLQTGRASRDIPSSAAREVSHWECSQGLIGLPRHEPAMPWIYEIPLPRAAVISTLGYLAPRRDERAETGKEWASLGGGARKKLHFPIQLSAGSRGE